MAELSSNDIKHLIHDYEAQVRRLQFEVEQAKLTIRSLKTSLSAVVEKEKEESALAMTSMKEAQAEAQEAPAPKGRRGRKSTKAKAPAKTEEDSTTDAPQKKKTKRKGGKKSAGKRALRPNEYDLYIFELLGQRGTPVISSEIVEYIKEAKAAKGETESEEEIFNMVARSLQKLANRRDDIKKVPYPGRGKAYALPEWMRGNKLMAKHARPADA